MSRAVFFLVLIAVVAICTHEANAQRRPPGRPPGRPVRPPGRPPGRPVRPGGQRPVRCGANQVWNRCGSACPPSCNNRRPTCATRCRPGCQCRPGFIRGPRGRCIRPAQCPRRG